MLLVIEVSNSLGSHLMILIINEGKWALFLVMLEHGALDGSNLPKELFDFVFCDTFLQLFDVHVGVGPNVLLYTLGPAHKRANIHLHGLQKHTIHLFNGSLAGLVRLKMDEPVTTRLSTRLGGHLARHNIPELREGVIQSLVVDGLVEVLDEDVAGTSLSQTRVTVGPHNPNWLAFNLVVVQGLKRPLSIDRVLEIDVSISQGATGYRITTDTDGKNGSNCLEQIKKHRFRDVLGQISTVEGGICLAACGLCWCCCCVHYVIFGLLWFYIFF
mmetsp:Transcript_110763/g.192005  ORF Transcript_110763/g.192005 Transcript_110763/m.192005 type:complete len:272 (-) Transcript_110763:38-853(-)